MYGHTKTRTHVHPRARSGLDTLGHVLFYHVPLHKVHRLLAAPLPQLRGQFMVTPSLTLRLALLAQWAGAKQKGAQQKSECVYV